MSKQNIINPRHPMASFAAPAYPTSYSIPHQSQSQAKTQQQARAVYPSNPQWSQLPPPPFPGAPPMPSNVAVNPQQWNAGYWQYNPAYNPAANSQARYVPWIPSQQWMPPQQQQPHSQASQQAAQPQQQQQQQQQASYNPYKRVPRPPSAEYLATKLSDNPLGLTNMVPAEVLYESGTLPDDIKTPWIWNPRTLDDVEEEEDEEGNKVHYGHRNNTTSPVPNRRSTDPSTNSTPKMELKPTFSTGIIRTPDHYKKEKEREVSASPSRVSSKGSRSSLDSQLSARMSNLSTGSSSFGSMSSAATSFTSMSSASPTKRDFSPSPMLTDQISEEPASMLSPLVIGSTPKLPGPSPLRQPLRAQATHPVLAPIEESSSSRGEPAYPNPLRHAETMPNPSKADHWRIPDRDRDRERDRDRDLRRESSNSTRRSKAPEPEYSHQHYSSTLGTKHAVFVAPPEPSRGSASPTSPPHSAGSRAAPSPQPSRSNSRRSSTHASPTYPSSGSLNFTPPNQAVSPRHSPPSGSGSTRPSPPSRRDSASAASTSTTSTITGPYGHPMHGHATSPPPLVPTNPLPDPPRWMHERDYRQADQLHFQTNSHTNGISSSYNAQASRVVSPPPAPPPPPAIHPPKPKPIRKGFWNRRGDHLTQSGYIVYAPPHRTFPEELQNYPAEDEGYQDEKEVFSSCYPRRPELPDSLPRMGKPPDRPYDSFVVYLTPEEARRAREAARQKSVAPRLAA